MIGETRWWTGHKLFWVIDTSLTRWPILTNRSLRLYFHSVSGIIGCCAIKWTSGQHLKLSNLKSVQTPFIVTFLFSSRGEEWKLFFKSFCTWWQQWHDSTVLGFKMRYIVCQSQLYIRDYWLLSTLFDIGHVNRKIPICFKSRAITSLSPSSYANSA